MKKIKFLPVLLLFVLASCSSVRVNSDYDTKTNFSNYKTFAYFKAGIDKASISDIDKKRILFAIDETLTSKGFTKSETPDILISIFTKETERVDVYNNAGFGWGWGGPFSGFGVGFSNVYSSPEGTLIIDILDAKTKELIWQGQGSGYLTTDVEKKDARVKEFVTKILEQYPPQKK
jgi:hypothetical protein